MLKSDKKMKRNGKWEGRRKESKKGRRNIGNG
jgi:hypothetical protein